MAETAVNGVSDNALHNVNLAVKQRVIDPSWSVALNISPDFLFGLKDLAQQQGSGVWAVTGQGWGRRWASRLVENAQKRGGDFLAVDLEEILGLLRFEVARGGWGELNFDLETQAQQGMILASLIGPLNTELPVGLPLLISGFIGGTLSVISDVTFDGHGVSVHQGDCLVAQMALAHKERMAVVRSGLLSGASWDEALSVSGDVSNGD